MFFEEGKNNSTYNQIEFCCYEMQYNPMCFSYVTGLNLQLVTAAHCSGKPLFFPVPV